MNAAVLILSDKGANGQRVDESGPALIEWLREHRVETLCYQMIADDFATIVETLCRWSDDEAYPLIFTCGGTGVSPRDVTPDATFEVVERLLPGFGEQMRAESLKITPMAILSRAIAGIRGRSLIVNLPGSPKAAIENLQIVWPAVQHAVDKISGDTCDCAGLHYHHGA